MVRHRSPSSSVWNRRWPPGPTSSSASGRWSTPPYPCAPEASKALFGELETAGFGFDVELLLRAQAWGYRIVEVPVNWADQEGSKVGVLSHGPAMLLQLLRARWRVGRR